MKASKVNAFFQAMGRSLRNTTSEPAPEIAKGRLVRPRVDHKPISEIMDPDWADTLIHPSKEELKTYVDSYGVERYESNQLPVDSDAPTKINIRETIS